MGRIVRKCVGGVGKVNGDVGKCGKSEGKVVWGCGEVWGEVWGNV